MTTRNLPLSFVLPLPPARGNRRGSTWLYDWRKDKSWAYEADLRMKAQGVRAPREHWPRLRIDLVFRLTPRDFERIDPDNLAHAARKPILDLVKDQWVGTIGGRVRTLGYRPSEKARKEKKVTLTRRGFIPDDKARYVELGETLSEISATGDSSILVTLTPRPALEVSP